MRCSHLVLRLQFASGNQKKWSQQSQICPVRLLWSSFHTAVGFLLVSGQSLPCYQCRALPSELGLPKLVKSQQLTQRATGTDSRWKYHVLLALGPTLVQVITDTGFIISFRAYLGWHPACSPYAASWLCLSCASQSPPALQLHHFFTSSVPVLCLHGAVHLLVSGVTGVGWRLM